MASPGARARKTNPSAMVKGKATPNTTSAGSRVNSETGPSSAATPKAKRSESRSGGTGTKSPKAAPAKAAWAMAKPTEESWSLREHTPRRPESPPARVLATKAGRIRPHTSGPPPTGRGCGGAPLVAP